MLTQFSFDAGPPSRYWPGIKPTLFLRIVSCSLAWSSGIFYPREVVCRVKWMEIGFTFLVHWDGHLRCWSTVNKNNQPVSTVK